MSKWRIVKRDGVWLTIDPDGSVRRFSRFIWAVDWFDVKTAWDRMLREFYD